MRELNKSGKVEVFLYFDREDKKYKFADSTYKDYTLLDGGEAICITSGLESDGFVGTWYFNDKPRQASLNNEYSSLKRVSKKLTDVFPLAAT